MTEEKEQRRRDWFYAITGEKLPDNVYVIARLKRDCKKGTLITENDVDVYTMGVDLGKKGSDRSVRFTMDENGDIEVIQEPTDPEVKPKDCERKGK